MSPVPAPEPVATGGGGACNDERDIIIQEYATHGVNWTPTCADLEQFADPKFALPEDTHSPWGIVKSVIYVKLAYIQEIAVMGNLRVTSGYRCPHKNAGIPGSATNSRHLYGDAMDLTPPAEMWNPPTEERYNQLRNAAVQSDPAYITIWSSYSDRHLHVDYR